MSSIEISWSGGEHSFFLPIAQLRALQDRCDAGPLHILQRLTNGTWRVDDVTETIRLALEGGGLDKQAARRLVTLHCESGLMLAVDTARVALMAALYDTDKDDPVGEAVGEAETPPTSPTENGNSASSTEPASSSDSAPPTSTE